MFLTPALQLRGRRQASNTTRWGGCSSLGRILLWTQNRQQLPTVWKQTVKQSRLLRLQHPIKCNLNQASHLFSIPFSLCFPSAFGQSLQLCSLTLIALDTFQAARYRPVFSPRKLTSEGTNAVVKECETFRLLSTDYALLHTLAGSVHFRGLCVSSFYPVPPAAAQITLQGYSGQDEWNSGQLIICTHIKFSNPGHVRKAGGRTQGAAQTWSLAVRPFLSHMVCIPSICLSYKSTAISQRNQTSVFFSLPSKLPQSHTCTPKIVSVIMVPSGVPITNCHLMSLEAKPRKVGTWVTMWINLSKKTGKWGFNDNPNPNKGVLRQVASAEGS